MKNTTMRCLSNQVINCKFKVDVGNATCVMSININVVSYFKVEVSKLTEKTPNLFLWQLLKSNAVFIISLR